MEHRLNILLIRRSEQFSPNSVERDLAILMAVRDELLKAGHQVTVVGEDQLPVELEADVVLSMGRHERTLRWLAAKEAAGTQVLNSARAMLDINRRRLLAEARRLGVGTPPFAIGPLRECPLPYPVWWKRDDQTSQERGDVVLVQSDVDWAAVNGRGITEYVVEQHLEGDLVKFYGVRGTDFFHWNYPQFSKFGNEAVNGRTRGLDFDVAGLARQADLLASTGLDIYGGDAIVTTDGRTRIIDLNDWPSFSSCRPEAARAIASRVQSS
ncbi:MAG: hypothetical protein IJ197_10950 [Bacteroidaceae bacterium]|nr:hypothetical protein [Bacteroidaceae bacterium]